MNRSFLLLIASAFAVSSCALEPAVESDESTVASASEALRAGTPTYFTARHDTRRCRWPLCGGLWLKRAGFAQTKCADGAWATECYVTDVDVTALGLTTDAGRELVSAFGSGTAIVRGTYARGDAGEFGEYAILRASEGWRAPTDAPVPARTTLYRVADSGIRCITTPCPSIRASKLNSGIGRNVVSVDYTDTHASGETLDEAAAAIGDGALIVAGYMRRRVAGSVLDAQQLYFPVLPTDTLSCERTEECGLTLYTREVTSPEDCYCPLCPVPANTVGVERFAEQWRTHCAAEWDATRCPIPSCAHPPPVACTAGRCGYGAIEP